MICETGNPDLFPELKIPRSTIRSWLHRGIPDVVTCDGLSAEETELLAEMQELRHRVAVLGAIIGLLVVMLGVSERRVDRERPPEGNRKRALLRAIERASRLLQLHDRGFLAILEARVVVSARSRRYDNATAPHRVLREGARGAKEGEPDGDLWRLCRRS
jgi:hypothetical protein